MISHFILNWYYAYGDGKWVWGASVSSVEGVKNYICRWVRETYIITHSLQFISIKISFADKNLLKMNISRFSCSLQGNVVVVFVVAAEEREEKEKKN